MLKREPHSDQSENEKRSNSKRVSKRETNKNPLLNKKKKETVVIRRPNGSLCERKREKRVTKDR